MEPEELGIGISWQIEDLHYETTDKWGSRKRRKEEETV